MVNTYAVQSGGCRFESLWGFGFYLKGAYYEVGYCGKKNFLSWTAMHIDFVMCNNGKINSINTHQLTTLSTVLAMATRCFSPPLSLRPLSPTMVSYWSGKASTREWMSAFSAASYTSASSAVGRPYRMLYLKHIHITSTLQKHENISF